MIADYEQPRPVVGKLAATIHNAGTFCRQIVVFVERELPRWRDRPERPPVSDEGRLNEYLCDHLDSAARRGGFDSIRFTLEPHQAVGRRGDVAVKPAGRIMVEGRAYYDFEQLLPIECKRLPTPKATKRSDLEYVHGVAGHRTGGIERFKHGDHGPRNDSALMIGYVQAGTFDHWLAVINSRLRRLATVNADKGLWFPEELLTYDASASNGDVQRSRSIHRRLSPPSKSQLINLDHLWVRMNGVPASAAA